MVSQEKGKIFSNDMVVKLELEPNELSKDFLRDFILFYPQQLFMKHSNFLTRLVKK